MGQTLGMVLMVGNLQALAADISLAAGIVLVRSNLGDLIVFQLDFKPAVLGSHHTGCFMPRVHLALLVRQYTWILLVCEENI